MPDCAGRRLAPAAPCCGACPEEPAGAARVLRGRRRAGYNRRPMKTSDLHVESNRPLLPPAILLDELPLGEAGSLAVRAPGRRSSASFAARTIGSSPWSVPALPAVRGAPVAIEDIPFAWLLGAAREGLLRSEARSRAEPEASG